LIISTAAYAAVLVVFVGIGSQLAGLIKHSYQN
jgi:hypothetical protein